MERWQGSVCRSFGSDQGRGAGRASRGTHMYKFESAASSIPHTDSESHRVFGMSKAVSKCNRETKYFDCFEQMHVSGFLVVLMNLVFYDQLLFMRTLI